MKVEVLYFKGCPNHQPTVERVRQALAAMRVAVPVEEVEVKDAATAQAVGFIGSPSVRVNGLDIEADARCGQPFGFGCRTCLEAGLRSGVPSLELVRKALAEAHANDARAEDERG